MTAYGAVISLRNTIHNILQSSRLTLLQPSIQILHLLYNELQPLQETLPKLDDTSKSLSRKRVNALDALIKQRVIHFEDLLESLLSDQILEQVERDDQVSFSIDLQCLHHDDDVNVSSFIQMLRDMKEKYVYELQNMPQDDDEDHHVSIASKMIGLSDQHKRVRDTLMDEGWRVRVHALVGMAGVGKTTLAREIFEDHEIVGYFECRVWLAVGRRCRSGEVSSRFLAELDPDIRGVVEGDEEIGEYLKKRLEGKRCMIVVDDVWESHVLKSLLSSLPDIETKNLAVLVTCRDRSVVSVLEKHFATVVRFLKEEESKELLCHKVFGAKAFPSRLDKAATKIAKKCEGLPLLIIAVADRISESEDRDDPEYWNDVAESKNSVFKEAYDEISKALFPTYNYLPQSLKTFFLYLGVFPPDYDIPQSKIVNMLVAEGWLLDSNETLSLESLVAQCLEKLYTVHNLVFAKRKSIFWLYYMVGNDMNKTCRLHSSWRHLCRGEAQKNKFFHVLSKLVDASEETIEGQRGLCLENNMLFAIKEFCNSVECYCASSTRSLLFFGPYHQYPIPIQVSFKLLKELEALNLRFYTFPTEILTLVQLKYLALTCNGEVPTTISKLFNLRVLIIHPHMRIQCHGAPPSIPVQIWDMQDLEHVEILGRSLEAPKDVASLEKLSALVGVNANISTISELFKRIPNVRKLGVEVELAPREEESNIFNCLQHISTLGSLETLKCSIINPVVKYGYVASSTPSSFMLPHGLMKLHLSGMGFPWEYMDAIGSLPSLKVLKLRSYAFRGSKWEAQEGSFVNLSFLLIEDSDLVQMKSRSGSFPKLNYLSMKYCYKLREFHWPRPNDSYFGNVDLVDCNPLAAIWAEELRSKYNSRKDPIVYVDVSNHYGA